MDYFSGQFLISVLQIVWIDILLSGDNAVVIALACRSLPSHQKRLGILLGAGTAVALRILFALIISFLLGVPYLRIVGGLLLFWIAIKLIIGEEDHGQDIEASDSLWKAVRTIAIADAVMSLDNVVAIAAASRGHPELFIFGLLLSIPLIMVGATLITALIARFPVFVWAGAALLGYIAAEMIVTDPVIVDLLANAGPQFVTPDPAHPTLGLGPSARGPLRRGGARRPCRHCRRFRFRPSGQPRRRQDAIDFWSADAAPRRAMGGPFNSRNDEPKDLKWNRMQLFPCALPAGRRSRSRAASSACAIRFRSCRASWCTRPPSARPPSRRA